MWPFGREKKSGGKLEKLVTGIIIGGAIGSIVGKKLLEESEEEEITEKENEDDTSN